MYKSLFALTLVCASISSFANPDLSGRNPFVDIQAQVLDTSTGKPTWQRLDHIPYVQYPTGLLNQQGSGCAIVNFAVTPDGVVKNLNIENSAPKRFSKDVRKAARQIVRDWQWPERTDDQTLELTMRFDYCLTFDYDKKSEAIAMCVEHSEQACE
ncbi:energy transducer TonB family protein [Pseudoalteromonas gelatinilytica]|jgi:TonB family protein